MKKKVARIIREYSAGKGEVSDEFIIDVINTFWAKTSSLSQAISQAAAYLQMDAGKVRDIAAKWDVTMEEGVSKLSPIKEGGYMKKMNDEYDDMEEMDPGDEYMKEMDKDLMDSEDMEMEGMYKNKDEEYDDMGYEPMMDEYEDDEYEDDEYYESVLRDDLVVKGHDGIIPKGTRIRVKKP